MILGIGNDIVEITRIKRLLERYPHRFLNRVFSPNEQEYCLKRKEPALHLAGRFAAKEAIVKALGIGFSQGLSWLDMEIRHDANGKPTVFFSSFANRLLNNPLILISISHCREYATAVAIHIMNGKS
jgi:holo-[acyl-carrier protein] synthase